MAAPAVLLAQARVDLGRLLAPYWSVDVAADGREALAKAQAGVPEELSASAKAQATYALIMEQTKTAQSDFARTSDGLANSMRTAKAQVADLAVQAGTMLLPYALQLVEGIKKLVTWFSNLDPKTMKTILTVMAAFICDTIPRET